ncbi:VWA domain-containing protein [Candidatus Sumerlaeota bacterium]|nr:VWA domain-containing protein [Candidatus Sumerlaeota bacterium]
MNLPSKEGRVMFDRKRSKLSGKVSKGLEIVIILLMVAIFAVALFSLFGHQLQHTSASIINKLGGQEMIHSPVMYCIVSEPELIPPPMNTEEYDHVEENPFLPVAQNPLSTFSIDVDTASYANVRRMIKEGQFPPAGAVRIEECVNYFNYDYAPPEDEHPFAVHADLARCPWAREHRLARIALKGVEVQKDELPDSNLVFLLDVSGSMDEVNKLGLLKRAFSALTQNLGPRDRVAIVVYAGSSGVVLSSTTCTENNKPEILAALDRLQAGGSTHGSAGIQLAYQVAEQNFIEGGNNRVILATDGDFNVGVSNQSDLVSLIQQKAKKNVFLSVMGFGMGNYKDSTMEKLADKGNGNYAYIDSMMEARKVLIDEMAGTLLTIAKDVKIQVEFNPVKVAAYRLIGYENRMLRTEDFADDKKDAGEIGAGHTVTAFYELVPAGSAIPGVAAPSELKYQKTAEPSEAAMGDELLTVKLRYKAPDSDQSTLLELPVMDQDRTWESADEDFQFAAAVAGWGMLLRDSQYKGELSWALVEELALGGKGDDKNGYRGEFLQLVKASALLERPRVEN